MLVWLRAAALALSLALGVDDSTGSHATVFAAPEIIVANDGPLARRVVLSDVAENQRLMLASVERSPVRQTSLRSRPRVRLAMYWGVQWRGKIDLPDSVNAISLTESVQAGAFYPAYRGQPALWQFGAYGPAPVGVHGIAPAGLSILAKHGIPISVK